MRPSEVVDPQRRPFAQPIGGRDERRKQVGPDRRGHVDVRPVGIAYSLDERTEALVVDGNVK